MYNESPKKRDSPFFDVISSQLRDQYQLTNKSGLFNLGIALFFKERKVYLLCLTFIWGKSTYNKAIVKFRYYKSFNKAIDSWILHPEFIKPG